MDIWLQEIFSGEALPLLYSLYVTSLSLWTVIILLTVSVFLCCIICSVYTAPLRVSHWSDCAVQLTSDVVKLLINTSTLLAKAQSSNTDTGALLCIAPLFTLLCLPGTLSPTYSEITQKTLSIMSTILILIGVWLIFADLSPHSPFLETDPDTWFVESCIQIVAGFVCTVNLEATPLAQLQSSLRLGILQGILASSRSFLGVILVKSDNLFIWFLHGVILLQSCLLLARSTRKQLGLLDVKDPARTTVLVNALLLAVAYAARTSVVQWGPATGIFLTVLKLTKFFM